MPAVSRATLAEGEAVLRFPYDGGLRLLQRAIPGRRWDPEERVWRAPLDPERPHALTMLLETVPYRSRSPVRSAGRSSVAAPSAGHELLVDLARPDSAWWFSFATDTFAGARQIER